MNELKVSVGRLKTAVTPPQLPTHLSQRERLGSAAQMAATLMARYSQGTALWQPLSPVLRESEKWQMAVTHQHQHQNINQTQLRSRLNLVLINHSNRQETNAPNPESTKPYTTHIWQSKRPTNGERHTATLVERLQNQETAQRTDVQRLAQRLNQQHQPIDMLSRQPKRTVPQPSWEESGERERSFPANEPQPSPIQPVPRILRQAQPPTEAKTPSTTQHETTVEKKAPFGVSRMEISAKDRGITAVDTNQLADQVMQKLENRLQAHRERTGRI